MKNESSNFYEYKGYTPVKRGDPILVLSGDKWYKTEVYDVLASMFLTEVEARVKILFYSDHGDTWKRGTDVRNKEHNEQEVQDIQRMDDNDQGQEGGEDRRDVGCDPVHGSRDGTEQGQAPETLGLCVLSSEE